MKLSKLEKILYNKSNISIATKIFIFSTLLFAFFLIIFGISNIFVFDRYYTHVESEKQLEIINEFYTEYSNAKNPKDIDYLVQKYSYENDAYITILNEFGDIMHMNAYKITLLPENSNETITLTIDNAILYDDFNNMNLQNNQKIKIKYLTTENSKANIHIPVQIIKEDNTWTFNLPYKEIEEEFQLKEITGKIMSITMPIYKESKNNIERYEIFTVLLGEQYNIKNKTNPENYKQYTYAAPETNNIYNIIIKKIVKSDHSEYIFSIKSINDVNTASTIISNMFITWMLLSIATSLILSLILTKMVAGPIIHITNITKKIKNMDFSEKCDVISQDEIGILASNINDMADKLDQSMTELIEANKQLIEDIEHEKLLEEQRKDFVAAVSHELKTPLAIIRAYSEGIQEGVSKEREEKYLKVIVDETKKMDTLIINMLESSKLENGTQKINLERNNLSEYIETIIKRFETPCKTKNIKLISEIDKDIYRMFDEQLLDQAITNFITNAIKYSNEKIEIKLKDGLLSVENTGNHIPEDSINKIWDKFYKVDKARDRSLGGTGLGLSITKNILELHKAEYGVTNTENGVRFWFKINNKGEE